MPVGARALPETATVDDTTPSVIVWVAAKLPSAVGAKFTVKVQVAPGPSAAVQVFAVIGKAENWPPLVKLSTSVFAPPVLVTVTSWAVPVLLTRTLPKSRAAGAATRRPAMMPVPVMVLTAGLPLVPATVTVAFLPPTDVGLRAMARVQAPVVGARLWPVQVLFTITNSPLDTVTVSAPEAVAPWLVTVKATGAPVWPTRTEPTSPATGVMTRSLGGVPVPLSATVTELPPTAESVTTRFAVWGAVVAAAGW